MEASFYIGIHLAALPAKSSIPVGATNSSPRFQHEWGLFSFSQICEACSMRTLVAAFIAAISLCTGAASAGGMYFDCDMGADITNGSTQHLKITIDASQKSVDVQDIRDGSLFATYAQIPVTRDNRYGYPPLRFTLPAGAASPWDPTGDSRDVLVLVFDSGSHLSVSINHGSLMTKANCGG